MPAIQFRDQLVLVNIDVIIPRDKGSPQHIPKDRRRRNDDGNAEEKPQAMAARVIIPSQVKSGRTLRLLRVQSLGFLLVNSGLIQPAELG